MGITIGKIAVDNRKQGKVTNIGKGFSAAGPALVLEDWLSLREAKDWEIKLDSEESQVGGG